jgi:hypothetical protein
MRSPHLGRFQGKQSKKTGNSKAKIDGSARINDADSAKLSIEPFEKLMRTPHPFTFVRLLSFCVQYLPHTDGVLIPHWIVSLILKKG